MLLLKGRLTGRLGIQEIDFVTNHEFILTLGYCKVKSGVLEVKSEFFSRILILMLNHQNC